VEDTDEYRMQQTGHMEKTENNRMPKRPISYRLQRRRKVGTETKWSDQQRLGTGP
jgi:hypothetical protein